MTASFEADVLARLTALEERTAHQSHIIEELSDEIARHYREAERMKAALRRMDERFSALEDRATAAPANVRPPHY